MAAVYFIDGQALEPTAFGRVNSQGVWVPKAYEYNPTQIYSTYLTCPNGFQSGFGPDKAFNGQVSGADNMAISASNGDTFTFAPEPPIPFTSEIGIFSSQNDGIASWNGNDWSLTSFTEFDTFAGSGEISAANPLTIKGTVNQAVLDAIRIDGQILVDGKNTAFGDNGFDL